MGHFYVAEFGTCVEGVLEDGFVGLDVFLDYFDVDLEGFLAVVFAG